MPENRDEYKLNETSLKIYLYLLSRNKPVGPREIMRQFKMSSPSIAYYHLRKLVDLGLVKKQGDGYVVAKKIKVEGIIIIGTKAIPRLLLYSSFLAGLLIIETIVLVNKLFEQEPVTSEYIALIILTAVYTVILGIEGFLLYRKIRV